MTRITDPALIRYQRVIQGLHARWTPHEQQIEVGRALFTEGIREIFNEDGRNWGKTELVIYLLWRWAEMHPGSENYYFGPFAKQAREILWAPQRLQTFGPREWIASVNNTEARLTFKCGSFIKVDGSDNFEAYRGVKPKGLIVYDEFKDFRPEFHIAFDPNRAAHNAPLIIFGTAPPAEEEEHQFFQVADEFKANPRKRWFNFPSWGNPHLDRQWLRDKKAELYARGEGHIWEREYAARRVKGGPGKIFAMLSDHHKKPHDWLVNDHLRRDRKKLIWGWWADPAGATVFGILFWAFNPYTRQLYFLDEIYETDQKAMTVGVIGPRIIEKRDELWPRDWQHQGYDEAATWFYNEFLNLYPDEFLEPSQKSLHKKESGLSLLKDLLLRDLLWFSDRCEKTFWEFDNYRKDKNGNIPKKNDHQIDNARMSCGALGLTFDEQEEPGERERRDEDFRGRSPEQDFPELRGDNDMEELLTWD